MTDSVYKNNIFLSYVDLVETIFKVKEKINSKKPTNVPDMVNIIFSSTCFSSFAFTKFYMVKYKFKCYFSFFYNFFHRPHSP